MDYKKKIETIVENIAKELISQLPTDVDTFI